MPKLPVLLALAALPFTAHALSFDFTTLGPTGLQPTSVTSGGVTARGYQGNLSTPANLWLRNESGDHGLGVCSSAENTVTPPATRSPCQSGGGDVNELDNNGVAEFILLERPTGTVWTSLWVSSLDSGGTGGSEEGYITWGDSLDALGGGFAFKWSDFGSSVEGDLFTLQAFLDVFDFDARYVLFGHPAGAGNNNDYLVWKGATGERLLPEPGSLALVGAAVVGLALRRRRH